jgi:hypothetical protein
VALTLVWNLIGIGLMLALAILATEEAGTDFQALVFLVVLIGYHRLTWQIAEDQQASRIRYLRAETWFFRIDSAIRGTPPATQAAAAMVAEVSNAGELEDLKETVERFARSRHVELWLFRATELLLLLAVVSIVLR